jgi:hypothetical protein
MKQKQIVATGIALQAGVFKICRAHCRIYCDDEADIAGAFALGLELIRTDSPYVAAFENNAHDLLDRLSETIGAAALSCPRCRAPALPRRAASQESPALRIRILYVEDNPEIREMACELLAEDSREIVALATAEDALNAWGRGKFDILITDISLPGMSGVELARRILKKTPSIPIIIASGLLPRFGGMQSGQARSRDHEAL